MCTGGGSVSGYILALISKETKNPKLNGLMSKYNYDLKTTKFEFYKNET